VIDEDSQLMFLAAKGDEDAFATLFHRYYSRAVNIAYRFWGVQEAAEDIAMEAFSKIYENRASFRGTSKFSTYLYRTLVNLCLNVAKRKSIVHEEPLVEEMTQGSEFFDPSVRAEQDDVSRQVRLAVLNLPPNQKLAIILTQYEQMSYREAAEVMKVSTKALESLLHRAKLNLRRALADFLDEDYGSSQMR